VQALIDAHADVDARENDGTTSLSRAAQQGHDDVVGMLLSAHANIEAKAEKGATPLE
jgi:ankyrin repeat protein